MRVELRPATAEDVAALAPDRMLPFRIKALTAFAGDTRVGIGGLVYRPDGVWAAVLITDEGRRYKVALYRAAVAVLRQARADGVTRIYAQPEPGRPGAEKLLRRLGFEPDGNRFVWRG